MWIWLQKEGRIADGANLLAKVAGEWHSRVEGDGLKRDVAIDLREADQAALLTRVPIKPIFLLLA